MSKSDEYTVPRPENIVRLKVDGAKSTVNTLREQQTARGVSLVCPFPALEVDIPVSFGNKQVMTMGSIHRIGVEDDPETGLPRLRLSIRNRECSGADAAGIAETVIAQTGLPLGTGIDIDVDAELGLNNAPGPDTKKEIPGTSRFFTDSDFGVEIPRDTSITYEPPIFADMPDGSSEKEPLWVDCRDVPLPEEFQDRVRTRRRYRMLKHVVVASVLALVLGSGYLLHRTQLVDFGEVKDRMMALSFGTASGKVTGGATLTDDPLLPVAKVEVPEVKTTVSMPPVPASPAEEKVSAPVVQEASYAPPVENSDGELQEQPNPLMAGLNESNAAEEIVESSPDEEQTDITLMLPTRWPVEYTSAYRVKDPNGVVVDVPGGLVRKEGWLPFAADYPMIRSIKSIQRESGARFIVYVNGELPRYITSPKGGGVALRLFYDKDGNGTSTVASR